VFSQSLFWRNPAGRSQVKTGYLGALREGALDFQERGAMKVTEIPIVSSFAADALPWAANGMAAVSPSQSSSAERKCHGR
jgi:hypothetical protein